MGARSTSQRRVTALLALVSAALIGGADFVGGLTSRRHPPLVVAVTAQLLGLAIGIPLALVWGWDEVSTHDVLFSIGSGVCVGLGFACFYTAMGTGTISLVVPLAAVTGATIPVTVGIGGGERPSELALAGIALALVAVAIVSLAPGTESSGAAPARTVVLSLGAGIAFGAFYVLFAEISEASGVWPVSLQRIGSVAVLGAIALLLRAPLAAGRQVVRPALAIAALEVAATVPLLLALQRGPLSIASVLASLYPVTTVALAALVLRERLSRLQLAGVGLALIAVVLVST